MGLQLAAQAASHGHRAIFFTLEYTEQQVRERLSRIGAGQWVERLEIDCSDDISARYIADKLASAASGTLAVIDYLQLLDQKRDQPALADRSKPCKSLAAGTALGHRLHFADCAISITRRQSRSRSWWTSGCPTRWI